MNLVHQRYRILMLVTVISAVNSMDRGAVGLALQDIKTEFAFSDSQLGIVTGLAVAMLSSIAAVPIARLADRGDRARIITLATATWSVATTLTSAVGGFLHLVLVRVFSSLGDVAANPPAQSLITDVFAPAERPRAMGIFLVGSSFAGVLGYLVGGWLNEYFGWRTMFLLIGLPGFLLTVVAWLWLSDPRRGSSAVRAEPSPPTGDTYLPIRPVLAALWRNRTFRMLLTANLTWAFFSTGIASWSPSYFIRTYGLTPGELGTWFALVFGGGGIIGVVIGGELASRFAGDNMTLQLRAVACNQVLAAAVTGGAYAVNDVHLALALQGTAAILGGLSLGPLYAALVSVVPSRMRATAVAISGVCVSIMGMGLGPLAIGILSDLTHEELGVGSLRFGLLCVLPFAAVGATFVWIAARSIRQDYALVEAIEA